MATVTDGITIPGRQYELPSRLPGGRSFISPIGEPEPQATLVGSHFFDHALCNDQPVIENLILITGSKPVPVKDSKDIGVMGRSWFLR